MSIKRTTIVAGGQSFELTRAQMEVFLMHCRGMSVDEIAAERRCSRATVNGTKNVLREKFGTPPRKWSYVFREFLAHHQEVDSDGD